MLDNIREILARQQKLSGARIGPRARLWTYLSLVIQNKQQGLSKTNLQMKADLSCFLA